MNTLGLMDLLSATALSHPLHRPRYSDQTWINQRALADPVLDKVTERYKVFRILLVRTLNRGFSSEAPKSRRGHGNSLYETCLQGIMGVLFVKTNEILDDR